MSFYRLQTKGRNVEIEQTGHDIIGSGDNVFIIVFDNDRGTQHDGFRMEPDDVCTRRLIYLFHCAYVFCGSLLDDAFSGLTTLDRTIDIDTVSYFGYRLLLTVIDGVSLFDGSDVNACSVEANEVA